MAAGVQVLNGAISVGGDERAPKNRKEESNGHKGRQETQGRQENSTYQDAAQGRLHCVEERYHQQRGRSSDRLLFVCLAKISDFSRSSTMKIIAASRLFQQGKQRLADASRYRLRLRHSKIHRFGVFAGEDIPAKTRVIEYAGERIGRRETRRRFLEGSPGRSRKQIYLAKWDGYWSIDGAVGGNGAELINHSCEPNMRLWKWRGRLWLRSLRRIRAGEELAYDYGFEGDGERVSCSCGSSNCRGMINRT